MPSAPAEVLVSPAHHSAPRYVRTLGPEVADLCSMVGFPPDLEQRLLLDDTFALDSRGLSAAFEVAAIACRQNLKTGWMKQAALGFLFITDQRLVVWSAHEFATAQEAFRDMETLITGSDMLRKRVKAIHRGNGDEAIELYDDRRLIFKTRTKGGGRGLSGDKVFLDEGFALQPLHMGALLPTLSARPDPQILYGSSAGLASSGVLRALRDRGRAGSSARLAYAEWCAPEGGCATHGCDHHIGVEGCAFDDVENWAAANPTMRKRITVAYIAAERQALDPEEFGRERMGRWDEPSGEMVVPAPSWADCLDTGSQIVSDPVFALDVSPSRSWAAIAVAGMRSDDLPHVEVTSSAGVVDHRPGTDWVVPRLVELKARWPGMRLVIGSGSAAESLVPALVEFELVFLKAGDVAAGCGLFFDLATTKGLRHLGQAALTAALAAARKNIDDGESAWRWGRRRSSQDISALYAGTLALWVVMQTNGANYDVLDSIL